MQKKEPLGKGPFFISPKRGGRISLERKTREESKAAIVSESRTGNPGSIKVYHLRRLGNNVEQVHCLYAQFHIVRHRVEDRSVELASRFLEDWRIWPNVIARRDQE